MPLKIAILYEKYKSKRRHSPALSGAVVVSAVTVEKKTANHTNNSNTRNHLFAHI